MESNAMCVRIVPLFAGIKLLIVRSVKDITYLVCSKEHHIFGFPSHNYVLMFILAHSANPPSLNIDILMAHLKSGPRGNKS